MCREDVPWRAAVRNMGSANDIPKYGLYRWFVEDYMALVAKAVSDLHS
jgi:hypothetical protein